MASVSGLINNNLAVNTLDGLTTVNTSSGPVDPSAYVKYTGNTSDTDLGSYNIATIHVPINGSDLTNKTYVDQQDATKVPYTGASANVNLGAYGLTTTALTASGTITASGVTTGTPAVTLGLNSSNQIVSYANPAGIFTGSVSAGSIPYASSANVFANSLLSQSGGTVSNSGNESITGTLTTTGNTSLTGGNITVSSTPVSWAVPYWTSTGYNLSSYTYTSGQGSAFGTVGATQCGLFSTGLSLAANTTYQMTITNMVFNSATGTNPYFTIQGGSNILYTSANNLTTTSTTRTFYFSTTVALPGGITLFFYDYLNGTTSPYFFFGTITVNAVSVQASSMAITGNESVGGTLTVGGATTVGALQVNGNLNVTGSGTFGTSMTAFNANHYNWNVGRFPGGGYFTTAQYWKIATLYGSTSTSMGAMYVRGMLGGWVSGTNDQMEVDLYIMTRGGTVVNGRVNSNSYANAVTYMDIQSYVNGSGYTEVYLVSKSASNYTSFDLDVGSSGLQGSLTTVQLWDPATTTALTSAPGTMTSLTALCQLVLSGTYLGVNNISPSATLDVAGTVKISGVTTTTGDVNLINSSASVTNSSTYQTLGYGITNTGGGTAKSIQLSVSGSSGWATQGTFGVYNGATASGEPNGFPLVVQATSGNVGIGVCGPSSQLHVKTTTSSSYTTPVVLIQNTQTNPRNCLTVLGSGLTAGNSILMNIGQDLSVNNAIGLGYVHAGSGSANNMLGISAYGSGDGLYVTAGGKVGIGNYSPSTGYQGLYKTLVTGTDSSNSGPHQAVYTSADNYPVFQQLNWTHDNITSSYDLYADGSNWRNSNLNGYQFSKTGGVFKLLGSNAAVGAVASLTTIITYVTNYTRQGVVAFNTAQPYCQIGGNGGGNMAVTAGGVVFGSSTMVAYASVGMSNTSGSGWEYANGRFWVPVEGRWLINLNFYFNSFSGGTRLQLQRLNSSGTVVETRYCCLNGAGFGSDTTYSYAGEMYCYYGDYLRVIVASGGGCTFYYGGMDHSHLTFTFIC
jgi:fibronectin-binding autotransporter adhesin